MGDGATARAGRPSVLSTLLFPGLALGLVALVFATPFNHDEDQYQAASVLAAHARLYRDILYVQTPLLPELTAPLTALAPGWTYLVLRLASAVFGLAALGGAWSAQRVLGAGPRPAAGATLLMASVYTFQYCASVVRNDALPMALLAWAIAAGGYALRPNARRPWVGWSVCGLLLGLAVSAKLSFAPLLGAAVAFAGARVLRRRAGGEPAALCAGAGLGLVPIALAWAGAPEAVRFALVGFWAQGPRRWYVANGLAQRLAPASKLAHGLGDLLLGPALAALAVVLLSRLRPSRSDTAVTEAASFLDLMILAGLVAAFAPSPTYKQYFAPLLPPLFVRLGLILAERRRPLWAQGALALGAATGLVMFALRVAPAAWTGGWTPVEVARENRWIGQTLAAGADDPAHRRWGEMRTAPSQAVGRAGVSGAIATLSAHAVLDSGFPLDRRFAGGAMIYRSADGVEAGLRRRLHVTSPSSLTADLDAAPPLAIVVGYEDGGGDTRVRLDAGLRAYALARGYVLHRSPFGAAELYVRPEGGARVAR